MNIYAIITPLILALLAAEIIYCLVRRNNYYNFQDTVANIGTAIGNQCVNLVVAVVVFQSYGWLHTHYGLTAMPTTWWSMLLLLLLIDFLFYWFHRVGHTVNVFWAAHMPHHSSEEMNLAVGLRASVTQRIFSFTFYWPLPLLGFSPEQIYTMAALHLVNGFWHHTRVIPKLGWFESIFNTPSHHRVHHGTNPQYLDKNFGELLIIWDKLFGTYEPEEEEVCYGVTHPPRSWDPTNIYFQYWKDLIEDARATRFWADKLKIWFMPLGWRPRDLQPHDDIGIGVTLDQQVKFQSRAFPGAKAYLLPHVFLGLGVMFLTIDKGMPLTGGERLAMSGLIFAMITAWGGILESRWWAPALESVRVAVTVLACAYLFQVHWGLALLSVPNVIIVAIAGVSLMWIGANFRRRPDRSPLHGSPQAA